MEKIPQEVHDIARQCAEKHKQDVRAAIDAAYDKVRNLDDFDEFVQSLVYGAISDLVYDCRHQSARAMKINAGAYGGAAKVTAGSSGSVQRTYDSLYNYRIAGTVLGCLYGRDLADIAKSEAEKASGHRFNAGLCAKLATMVPDDKRVHDVVSEKTLGNLFRNMEKAKA